MCCGVCCGGESCGQTGAVGLNHLSPFFHPLWKQSVCMAANNSFLLLWETKPSSEKLPAVIRVCVRVRSNFCDMRPSLRVCLPVCLHVFKIKEKKKVEPAVLSMPKTKPSFCPDGIFCYIHTHPHSTMQTAVFILSADFHFVFSKRPVCVWFVLFLQVEPQSSGQT